MFECAGAVKTAIETTVNKLKENGHELIEMSVDLIPQSFELFIRVFLGEDGRSLMNVLQGEDPTWPYLGGYYEYKYPFVGFLSKLLLKFSGYHEFYAYFSKVKPLNHDEFYDLAHEFQAFRVKFNEYWQSLSLDAAICPIWPLVAPYHETTMKLFHAFSYSFIWNVLDYPAGVVPVKFVEPGEDVYESMSKDASVKIAKENMKESVGLPVCVQVVANSFQDEVALGLMKTIQDLYTFEIPVLDNRFS